MTMTLEFTFTLNDLDLDLELHFNLDINTDRFQEYDLVIDLGLDCKLSLPRMLSKISVQLRYVLLRVGGWVAGRVVGF